MGALDLDACHCLMPAAAEFLHHDLHIDSSVGTGRDADTFFILTHDRADMDIVHGEEFIRRLGHDHRLVTVFDRAVMDGNGKARQGFLHFCNDLCTPYDGHFVFLEELGYHMGIRTAASQEGSRLKCTLTGLDGLFYKISIFTGADEAFGDDAPVWRRTPRGLSYAGPRVLDGWLWRAGNLSVIPPALGDRTSSIWTVPASVAGHPVQDFDAALLPEIVAELELPPTLRCADFPGRVPDVIRTTNPATDLDLHGRKPRLLFFPPGRYELYPFGVNVGLTRLLPADADLAAQLAVPHQNRDCGGWLWIPVGDDAAQLVGYRGPLPTNGVLRLPAFVGPEDRLPAAPSDPPTLRPSDPPTTRPPDPQTNASARPARRVVSVSPYVFRRPDASAERERGPRFALEIPEGVETIGAFAFENTLRIESVRLPSTLRSLGPGAFSNCGNLKEIDLPEGVKEIPAGCFLGCAALERVSAPGTAEIDALAFAGCERLANLRLPTDPRPVFHPSATLDCPALRRK